MRTFTRFAILALIAVVFSASAVAQYSQPVRDVENPARTPYWGHTSGTIEVNYINQSFAMSLIPAGQRLVIEHVGVRCYTDTDDTIQEATIWVNQKTPTGSSSYSVPLLTKKLGNTWDGKAVWVTSQQVRLYNDGGTGSLLTVMVYHSKVTATAACYVHVTGYTLSTP